MRTLFVFLIFILFVLILPSNVGASLLTVNKDGLTTWSVLSYEDEIMLEVPSHSSIEVKNIAESPSESSAIISLTHSESGVNMVVSGETETRNLELSDWKEDIVELEERPKVKNIKIGVIEDKFTIRQNKITALTGFPLTIDSESANLSLETSTGKKYLSVLPLEAVETLVKSKLLTNVKDNRIEIIEEDSNLQYKIAGNKVFNFFKLFDYPVEVSSKVSASTGEILSVDGPTWFKVINFLMT